MAWLTGYTYRKKGSVVATVAGAQTYFQKKLLVGESSGASGEEVDCEGGCRAFPNDLRFTGADGETKHDYWVESITGTTPNRLATIWIKVATIPASGDVDFYMYYDKRLDSGESSGDDTFVLYDVSGIQAFWQMDEASWDGTPDEVEDETGVNDAVAVNGADTISDGKFNRAGSFDGISKYIDCGGDNSLNFIPQTDAFTLIAWIKVQTAADYQVVIDKATVLSATRQYQLMVNADTTAIWIALGGKLTSYADLSPFANSWHHLMLVVPDASSGAKLYIDNVEQTPTTGTGAIGTATNAENISIGRETGGNRRFFKGHIDEIQIIECAITSTERGAFYNNYMQKIGSYYNVRKWASPEPTWGTWGGAVSEGRTRTYAYIIG